MKQKFIIEVNSYQDYKALKFVHDKLLKRHLIHMVEDKFESEQKLCSTEWHEKVFLTANSIENELNISREDLYLMLSDMKGVENLDRKWITTNMLTKQCDSINGYHIVFTKEFLENDLS